MIGIILVSHSDKITEGLKEMIDEMVGESPYVNVLSAGGTGDGRLGTNSLMILEAIQQLEEASDILIFGDIGSAILCAETAMDLIDDAALQSKTFLIEAPLIEGAFTAAVQASASCTKEQILQEMANIS
ncbi:PTS-dependent dihydroxyacetone kinase phosphotransferase subunit DhaM [Desemzia sp. C1]|uniref:dihydroxyacetone kinase phosphoryl donor subunit DhaM n=1 Tax=Desemzia sp. C1 TaxID=2892016 RepID=UPI001E4AF3C9|nr:dihydroxyacetone kinase phosphoryl donor subunit DhaM [Desemzia sp. C1]MCI3028816.1 PTS-dependent dihydroxyacetone kinase phosphotransferase subunit DhaM [Desemzia sp. C1]